MAWVDPRYYSESQRQRWLRPDWQRFVRHDAHRFQSPAELQRKSRAMQTEVDEAALAIEQEALRADLQHLRELVKDLKIDLEIRRLCRKYSPDQPRDDHGRWADTGKEASSGTETDSGKEKEVPSSDPTEILALARRLKLVGGLGSYAECLNLCYPVLERRQAAGSDRNTFDFYKCMNACMGRNP